MCVTRHPCNPTTTTTGPTSAESPRAPYRTLPPPLQWTDGDTWQAVVRLPVDTDVQYKYVLVKMDGGGLVCWEGAEQAGACVKGGCRGGRQG